VDDIQTYIYKACDKYINMYAARCWCCFVRKHVILYSVLMSPLHTIVLFFDTVPNSYVYFPDVLVHIV